MKKRLLGLLWWVRARAVDAKWYCRALVYDWQGRRCHFCGRPNFYYDDCGFFYILDPRLPVVRDEKGCINHSVTKSFPACLKCNRKHGWLHIELYGMGER